MNLADLMPKPTFTSLVEIPVAGAETIPVEFEFRFRRRTELKLFLDRAPELTDEEATGEIVAGWALSDPYNAENLSTLLQNCHGAARAIATEYLLELTGGRITA